MRILMVAPQPFFRPRGTPFSVLHRIRALRRLGHSVHLLTYPFGEDPGLEGVQITRTARPPLVRDVPIGPSFAKIALDGPLFAAARRAVRRGGFDLLHTHEEAGFLGAWLARRYGIPHLYDMHSSLPQQFSNFDRFDWVPVVSVFRWLERYTLEGSDAVIAICPELEDHLQELAYPGPVAMIENTLDFDHVEPGPEDEARLRADLGVGDRPVVLYTGSLEAYQGLDLLIQAAPAVVGRVPDVRFVVVGGVEAQIDQLRARCREAGAEASFVLRPAVPPGEVYGLLRMSTCLVTCRKSGTNTPLKLYQYLRAGKPIVATGIRSHTQVLDASVAELVDPTPSSVADGLVRVLEDPERGRGLGDRALARSRDRYGEEVYLDRLSDLLDRMGFGTALASTAVT